MKLLSVLMSNRHKIIFDKSYNSSTSMFSSLHQPYYEIGMFAFKA